MTADQIITKGPEAVEDAIRRLDSRADQAEHQNDYQLALMLRQEAFYLREESRRHEN